MATKIKRPKTGRMPDLSNATPGSLVDWIGGVREELKDLKKLEGFFKEGLLARLDGKNTVTGDDFSALVEDTVQDRFNKDLAIAKLTELGATEDEIAECYKTIEFKTIRTSKN